MSEFTSSSGVWKGWHWRYVSITVLVVAVLQAIAYYTFHYDLVGSLPIAVLSVAYLTILRVKERRLANALAGVLASFIVGVILQVALQQYGMVWHGAKFYFWLESDLWALGMGIVMAYAYLRLTLWSERKRAEVEAKRSVEKAKARPQMTRRHHQKKKRK